MKEPLTFDSLDTIARLAAGLPAMDRAAARAAEERQRDLTKPPGSLGRLEELAVFLAGWRGTGWPDANWNGV